MAKTRTGQRPIGFRRRGKGWQTDTDALIRFAREAALEVIDLPAPASVEDIKQIHDAGLRVGTVDLPPQWGDLVCADEAQRREAVQRSADYIRQIAPLGVNRFFIVLLPKDPSLPRSDNMNYAVDAFQRLIPTLNETDARVVIEGFPGGGPHFASIACTPADFRIFSERVGSERIGVNYDPSHLVRMGIDPLRFAREFADRIYHVHAKDTEILDEALYEHGNLQPATEARKHQFGAHFWRYTIPGHGRVRWGRLLEVLDEAGYQGALCIELEDENFNGSPEGEQAGLIASRDFLMHV